MKLLDKFTARCRLHYSLRLDTTAMEARSFVYKTLRKRYGIGPVLRHMPSIAPILDRSEESVRQEAMAARKVNGDE